MERSPTGGRKKVAVIIGAGPAGLTAAYELLAQTDVHPIVLEMSQTHVGGISKTFSYKGNRIDIGGHRFFSKSDTVMDWWLDILPLQTHGNVSIAYQGNERMVEAHTPSAREGDDVMLLRERTTRIYYNKKFFAYPVSLSADTLRKLGFVKVVLIGITYLFRILFPRRPEVTLEYFFVNRFGDELYKTFFKSYTEKVWGKPCGELSAAWGAQRIKGLSVMKAVVNAIVKPFRPKDIKQKGTETSLIEQFLYPKYGPGHLWEVVARKIRERGGDIRMGVRVTEIIVEDGNVGKVIAHDSLGNTHSFEADYVFSTMPIKELAGALGEHVPKHVNEIAQALEYRDFVTVGVLVRKRDLDASIGSLSDTWIYIHEPNVLMGRIQVFNNWSPYLVADDAYLWLGLEYFCTEGDAFWTKSDDELKALAARELETIGFMKKEQVADSVVLREKKTYPVYAGAYEHFSTVQEYLDAIPNLFPVGRNGMHRYNNQDHSMLTAMGAVALIKEEKTDKRALWEINTEQDYHEEKTATPEKGTLSRLLTYVHFEKVLVLVSVLVSLTTLIVLTHTHVGDVSPVMYGQDSEEYLTLGKHLFEATSYTLSLQPPETPEGYRPPGYPLFLAALFPFHNFLFGASVVQILLYALTVLFMYRLTARFVSPRVAFITALLLILNVSAVYYSVVILSDMLLVFLVVSSVYWFLSYEHDNARTKHFMLYAGAALGGAALTRPVTEFLPLVFAVMYYAYHMRMRLLTSIRPFMYFLIAFAVVVSPWVVRNYAQFGVATISSVGQYNLLLHNVSLYHAYKYNLSLDAARRAVTPKSLGDYDHIDFGSPLHVREYSTAARAYILGDPFGYGAFHLMKTIPFFFGDSFDGLINGVRPDIGAAREINLSSLIMRGEFSPILRAFKDGMRSGDLSFVSFSLNLLVWTCMYLLAIIGVVYVLMQKVRRSAPRTYFFLLTAVAFVVYFAILTGPVSMPRYRLPAEPFIFVLVGYGVVLCIDYIRSRRALKRTHEHN